LNTSSPDSLQRALDFVRGIEDRGAQRRVPFKWGTAFFHDEFPRIHDLNFLRVDGAPDDATPQGLAAEADRLLGGASLSHRKIVVQDESLGERLTPGFEELGWEIVRLLYMEARRESERALSPGVAAEVDIETFLEARELSIRADRELVQEEDLVVQLRDSYKVWARACVARPFAAFVDGEPVSTCELYSDGATAQIESVLTLEEHRNRGLGVAVVLLALHEARKAGDDMVFLIAEDDDWPKELYEKLGFDPIGRTHEFKIPDVSKKGRVQPQD